MIRTRSSRAHRLAGFTTLALGLVVLTVNVCRADEITDPWVITYDPDAGNPFVRGKSACVQNPTPCVASGCHANTDGFLCGGSVPAYFALQDTNPYGTCQYNSNSPDCTERTGAIYCARVGVFTDRIEGNCDGFVCFGYVVLTGTACDVLLNARK
jgi:hypothetical protein